MPFVHIARRAVAYGLRVLRHDVVFNFVGAAIGLNINAIKAVSCFTVIVFAIICHRDFTERLAGAKAIIYPYFFGKFFNFRLHLEAGYFFT